MAEKTNGAGLIGQVATDMAVTEPRPSTGIPLMPNVWENAAVAAGRSWADDICQNDRDCQCRSCAERSKR